MEAIFIRMNALEKNLPYKILSLMARQEASGQAILVKIQSHSEDLYSVFLPQSMVKNLDFNDIFLIQSEMENNNHPYLIYHGTVQGRHCVNIEQKSPLLDTLWANGLAVPQQ